MENQEFFKAAGKIVGVDYSKLSQESVQTSEKQIINLLNQRAMPEEPWSVLTI
jgi:hypothetical protein